ncbi:uncharacterized protein B0T15DRAFT_485164 [Chaetomium strumarium]|uniref:F-box domain-containing protein n=1 Tax=Chaetomium strumarium TaxID=1170767 RepID=A0AAJ0GSY5_9PEZI|nr:hypothetical protein B0T15DRAFT_485164 [Chaetomium strumarium]
MGQVLSRLFRAQLPPTLLALLRLPAELIFYIVAQLSESPESAVALSLTCKCLRSILADDIAKVPAKCRGQLLALLENDLGDGHFYCSICCQLHVFSAAWNPTSREHLVFENIRRNRFYCHAQQVFNPNGAQSPYHVFGRLVMNRHFYGAPKGLPLDILAKPFGHAVGEAGRCGLFLRVIHTLGGKAVTLRDAIDEGRSCICMHVATDLVDKECRSRKWLARIPELSEPEREPEQEAGESALFRPCRREPGSCAVCLTDWVTTVERAEVRDIFLSSTTRNGVRRPAWELTRGKVMITAYHQLGSCRDIHDWKWVALTQCQTGRSPSSATNPPRDIAVYPHGVVQATFENGWTCKV